MKIHQLIIIPLLIFNVQLCFSSDLSIRGSNLTQLYTDPAFLANPSSSTWELNEFYLTTSLVRLKQELPTRFNNLLCAGMNAISIPIWFMHKDTSFGRLNLNGQAYAHKLFIDGGAPNFDYAFPNEVTPNLHYILSEALSSRGCGNQFSKVVIRFAGQEDYYKHTAPSAIQYPFYNNYELFIEDVTNAVNSYLANTRLADPLYDICLECGGVDPTQDPTTHQLVNRLISTFACDVTNWTISIPWWDNRYRFWMDTISNLSANCFPRYTMVDIYSNTISSHGRNRTPAQQLIDIFQEAEDAYLGNSPSWPPNFQWIGPYQNAFSIPLYVGEIYSAESQNQTFFADFLNEIHGESLKAYYGKKHLTVAGISDWPLEYGATTPHVSVTAPALTAFKGFRWTQAISGGILNSSPDVGFFQGSFLQTPGGWLPGGRLEIFDENNAYIGSYSVENLMSIFNYAGTEYDFYFFNLTTYARNWNEYRSIVNGTIRFCPEAYNNCSDTIPLDNRL